MSNYIAKKVSLDTAKECTGRNCGCYTSSGYYIQYKNRNVDSILFVCEECFSRQYRSMCTLGDFQETEYVRSPQRNPYQLGNPTIRKVAAVINKGLRTVRISLVLVMLLLLAAFSIKEQPSVRNEFATPEINTVTWEFNELNDRFKSIGVQIERVITHGGNKND